MPQNSDPFQTGADVHFPEKGQRDWRDDLEPADDPDDELLHQTPEDVIAILGFDPLELDHEEEA